MIRQIRSSHRDSFRKYLFFFSRSHLFIIFQEDPFVPRTDMNFPGGSICSSNRYEFSRRAYRKDMFFQGGSICSSNRPYYLIEQILISQKPLFSPRTHTNFPGASIFSSNRYSFSRKPYLVLEHLRFSRRLYLVLEHIQFSRSPLCLEHIGIFQEGTPSRTDISLIGLGGCFRQIRSAKLADHTPTNFLLQSFCNKISDCLCLRRGGTGMYNAPPPESTRSLAWSSLKIMVEADQEKPRLNVLEEKVFWHTIFQTSTP